MFISAGTGLTTDEKKSVIFCRSVIVKRIAVKSAETDRKKNKRYGNIKSGVG